MNCLKAYPNAHSKANPYNPELAYTHMKRMRNLLQSYNEENSFLNKQVEELLNQKRIIESKYAVCRSKENVELSFKGPFRYQHSDLKKDNTFYPNECHTKKYEYGVAKNYKQGKTGNETNKVHPKVQSSSATNSRVFFHDPPFDILK
jgi:DNA-directed RNA polymerase beta subunit